MKNWIILLLIGACAILLLKELGRKDDGIGASDASIPAVKKLVDTEVKRVNKKIDNEGFEHAVINEIENTINSDTKLSDSVRAELDSVLILLDIKENQLKHYIRYSTTLQDSLLKANQIINDKGDTVLNYSDKWANITYVPDISGGYFNFKYDAEINYAEYWKRDGGWLSRPNHYIDFWISDKRATVNGVNRVNVQTSKHRPRFQVNAVGIYLDGIHLGVDGQFRVGDRYWVGGGYLYDFDNEKWRPSITGRLNVIDW